MRLIAQIPLWLKGTQSASVVVTDCPTPFTPFVCLNSICKAQTGSDHEPWCFHVSFHGAAFSATHCWPRILATRGASPATPHDTVISSWPARGAAGFPWNTFSGRRCWPWPHRDWGRQHHCPAQIRSGASRAAPDSDLGPYSGPAQLQCSRGPRWGCCVSCTPILDSLCDADRYAQSGCWGHPGCPGQLAPRPSSSGPTTSCPAGFHRLPSECWAMAKWGSQRGWPGHLPLQGCFEQLR